MFDGLVPWCPRYVSGVYIHTHMLIMHDYYLLFKLFYQIRYAKHLYSDTFDLFYNILATKFVMRLRKNMNNY